MQIKEKEQEIELLSGELEHYDFPGYQFMNDIRGQREKVVNKFDDLDKKMHNNKRELLEMIADLDAKICSCRDDFTELMQGFETVKQQGNIDKLTLHKYENTVEIVQRDLIE